MNRNTAGYQAINESRALRLVLTSLRAEEDVDAALDIYRTVLDEVEDRLTLEFVTSLLAAMLAEELEIRLDGAEKAAADCERRIAHLLDFAAKGGES
jgi:hypothetical protein